MFKNSMVNLLPLAWLICLIGLTFCQKAQNPQGVPFINTDNHGYQADGSMDLTFARSTQQKNEFMQNAGKVQPGTNFLQHLFETDGDDDFHFTVPVEQQIAIYAYAYVADENTYLRVKDVNLQPPVRLAIFEGDDMIVKANFFFQKYIVFNGNKDKKYSIKIQTSGNNKLISLSVKLFVQQADIKKNMKKSEADKYSTQTRTLKTEISQLSNKFGVYWIIDENNLRHSVINVRRYYYFELLEMAVVGVTGYLQVSVLFKLLKGNAIIV